MILSELLKEYVTAPGVKALAKVISDGSPALIHLQGLQASSTPTAFAALTARNQPPRRPFLFILNDEEEAGYFYHDLKQTAGEENTLFYPSSYRRAVKYGQRDAAGEILRTEVLGRLANFQAANVEGPLFIVTHPKALTEKVATPRRMAERTIRLAKGENHDLTELIHRLFDLGFERRDYVYEPGEYALRGSILDVYSYASEYPFRIDFFGDEIDSIRTFEVQTQISKQIIDRIDIIPDTEDGGDGLVPFTDYLPAETVLCVKDLGFIHDTIGRIYDEGFARQAEMAREVTSEIDAEGLRHELRRESLLTTREEFLRGVASLQRINFGTSTLGEAKAVIRFTTERQQLFHKNFELLLQNLRQLRTDGFRIFILADSLKQTERLAGILNEMNAQADLFTPVEHTLHEGFIDRDLHLAFLTDHQIFDRYHKYNLKSDHARDTKMALTLKELMQFEPGDFIVHIDHGVGRFAGLVRMPMGDGEMQEMIKLTYKNDDAVYVSIHSLHKVSKYKGKEGEPPRISTLGTGAWEKLKERTKKKIKDIARDLIRLYSERKEKEGFAFSADSFMQHELEAGFAYEDTPDQLKVTQEVKADMESRKPMDRLVCGDVGFGKTEIAVRAALKAAADNKQVAVLVPTTVLALQHFKTFQNRLKASPSRLTTSAAPVRRHKRKQSFLALPQATSIFSSVHKN